MTLSKEDQEKIAASSLGKGFFRSMLGDAFGELVAFVFFVVAFGAFFIVKALFGLVPAIVFAGIPGVIALVLLVKWRLL